MNSLPSAAITRNSPICKVYRQMNTLTTRLLRLTCTAIAAAWLGGVSAWGQSLLESFRSQCDTLSVLVKERTSVKAALKISSVKIRNGALDFYFTASLGDIPIGAEDVKWLKSTIKSLTPEKYRSYKIGSIFIGGLSINEFIAEAPGNDGSSHPNRWKPATIPPATTPLVTAEDGHVAESWEILRRVYTQVGMAACPSIHHSRRHVYTKLCTPIPYSDAGKCGGIRNDTSGTRYTEA